MQQNGPTDKGEEDQNFEGPPPPPDNPPPMPEFSFGPKLSAEAEKTIKELKEAVIKLMPAVRSLDPKVSAKAKEEYNHLRKGYYDPYTNFNKKEFNPVVQEIDQLKEKIQKASEDLKTNAEMKKKKIQKIDEQINILNKQYSQYANGSLKSNIEKLLKNANSERQQSMDELQQMEIDGEALAKDYEKKMQDLLTYKKKLMEKKQEFEAILKAIPELKKETKKAVTIEEADTFPLSYAEISDQLQGVWLYYLTEFLGPFGEDKDITTHFAKLTDPEIRKGVSILLPVKVVLGIAAGYIVRPPNVAYNDLDPLKGTEINPEQKESFEILLKDCYANNPSFKGLVDKPKNMSTISGTLSTFTGTLMEDLGKKVKPIKKEHDDELRAVSSPSQKTTEPNVLSPSLKSTPVTQEKASEAEEEPLPQKPLPRARRTFEEIEKDRLEKEQIARQHQKETGYRMVKRGEETSSTQETTKTPSKQSKPNRNQSNPQEMMNQVILSSKHLQLISQLAEDFDGEIPEDLSPSQYTETLDKRLQFITSHIVSERKMLQEERKRFASTESALEKLRKEMDPDLKDNTAQLSPSEQIEKATKVMQEMKKEVVHLQEQVEEAITPVQILQKEKLAGLGHAYSHYKATHHGQAPSMKEMNEWGDASGLRKNSAWKTTVSNAAKLSDEYDENEQKNSLRKKK